MRFIVRFVGKDPLPHTLCIWLSVLSVTFTWAIPFASDALFDRIVFISYLWTFWMGAFMVYCMRQEKKNRS